MRGHVKLLAIAATVSALLLIALPAGAITGGALDGERHPNVGLLVVGGRPVCSGVLVAPRVFLTAGHCTTASRGAVTFDTTFDRESPLAAGSIEVHPLFGHDRGDLHDLAVVVLDEPAGVAPAKLPGARELDALAQHTQLTSVGYGVYERSASGGKHRLAFDGARRYGHLELVGLTQSDAKLLPDPSGLCFGDSGGPALLGDTVVAVTSWGSAACEGASAAYRLDTASARGFLGRFVSQ